MKNNNLAIAKDFLSKNLWASYKVTENKRGNFKIIVAGVPGYFGISKYMGHWYVRRYRPENSRCFLICTHGRKTKKVTYGNSTYNYFTWNMVENGGHCCLIAALWAFAQYLRNDRKV